MRLTGEIKKLKWGVIPNMPYWIIEVDKTVGGKENLVVLEIVKEKTEEGVVEFHVVCAKKEIVNTKEVLGVSFVWKTYNKTPDEIEYFLPDEKHNYVKA